MAIDFDYAMRELHKGNNKPMDELIETEQNKLMKEIEEFKEMGKVIAFYPNTFM